VVLLVLALPTGHRRLEGRTPVLFPVVLAVRARRLLQPPPHGTAGNAGGIAHGASMPVSRSALEPIPYRADWASTSGRALRLWSRCVRPDSAPHEASLVGGSRGGGLRARRVQRERSDLQIRPGRWRGSLAVGASRRHHRRVPCRCGSLRQMGRSTPPSCAPKNEARGDTSAAALSDPLAGNERFDSGSKADVLHALGSPDVDANARRLGGDPIDL
jgi:hypothetical protein